MLNVSNEIWEDAVKDKSPNAFFNFLLARYERQNNLKQLNSKPYILYLDPVSFCNLQCPFCETGKRRGSRENAVLDLKDFENIIDSLGEFTFRLTLYNWGEPFLNPELPKMVNHAKKYSIFTDISTNLSIPLSEDWLNELIKSDPDLIICSIDGASQETYQKYRVGGNFDLAIKNMGLLSKIKSQRKKSTPHILWRFFVFKHNQHEIETAKKLAAELGVEIKFAKPYISDFSNPEEWVSTIPPFSNNVVSRGDQTKNKKDSIINLKGEPNQASRSCSWLWSTLVINANKSISPCCATHLESNDFGKIDIPIDSLWNNEKFLLSRNSFCSQIDDKQTICSNCPVPTVQPMAEPWNEAISDLLMKKLKDSKFSQDIYTIIKKHNMSVREKTQNQNQVIELEST